MPLEFYTEIMGYEYGTTTLHETNNRRLDPDNAVDFMHIRRVRILRPQRPLSSTRQCYRAPNCYNITLTSWEGPAAAN